MLREFRARGLGKRDSPAFLSYALYISLNPRIGKAAELSNWPALRAARKRERRGVGRGREKGESRRGDLSSSAGPTSHAWADLRRRGRGAEAGSALLRRKVPLSLAKRRERDSWGLLLCSVWLQHLGELPALRGGERSGGGGLRAPPGDREGRKSGALSLPPLLRFLPQHTHVLPPGAGADAARRSEPERRSKEAWAPRCFRLPRPMERAPLRP